MKTCLLLTYPDAHLRALHQRRPDLRTLPFKEQAAALQAEIAPATTLWAPALLKAGHEVRVIVANDEASQTQWARERLGDGWQPASTWMQDVVVEQLRKFKVDTLLVTDPVRFDGGFARRVQDRVPWIVAWADRRLEPKARLAGFDLVLSPHESVVAQARESGASDARLLAWGFPRFIAEQVFMTPVSMDVVCHVNWRASNAQAREIVTALASPSASFSLGLYVDAPADAVLPEAVRAVNRGSLHGLARYRSITSARLVVADPFEDEGVPGTVIEAAGLGVASLAKADDRVAAMLAPDREVFTYRDATDFVAQLKDLTSPASAERVTQAGRDAQERCLVEHAIEARANELAEMLKPGQRETLSGWGRLRQWIKS